MVHSLASKLRTSFRRFRPGVTHDGIPSPKVFSRILERERERSDRSGQGFSLVVFELKSMGDGNGYSRVLVECILSRRVRAIDEVGWFKDGAIGATLPGTSTEGAWKFAHHVLSRIPRELPAPVCRVYWYPSASLSGGNGQEGRQKPDATENGSHHTVPSFAEDNSGMPQSLCMAESLETLFGRSMPVWKRFLDIIGALVGLILLSPLFLMIAFFIKIVSPGPVFFKQERIGYRGKPFTFWKFRTMHVNNDAAGHRQYLSNLIQGDAPMTKLDDSNDNRIIPLGKVFRSGCLDELPQLINVLLGDMSLVGPRPCLPYEAQEYLLWHARRFDTVPGMTGLWQVSGKNRLTFKEMIRLDIRYSRSMSPWLDTKILLLTGPAIFAMVTDPVFRKLGIGQESTAFLMSGKE
jgi:lipopolysaccharide/colanic/teichoic acid biosynthesis glycosyltransferase